MARRSAADFHLRHLLFSFDSSPAAPPEKVAGYARFAQDRGQGYHQRRLEGHDHGAQGRLRASARSSEQSRAGSDQGLGIASDDGRGRSEEQVDFRSIKL